ncbi:DUF11 domain-containing protein [Nannocystis radixulma]|uniref:DUF11 domain-containing protein n=1 Tax=Nannocystis radixulma TaxID=2995305 RepID=A0ABT5BMI9_9BACT|nr:DUF11 domain-containing protein [Nannocystis radixulma]MDC0674883.1 DUF11 domain-containing protein [Nannocystis radixulma]
MIRSRLMVAVTLALAPLSASAADFAAGSLVIPMDTDYQDLGMLRAYGLVYELLRQGVPVHWAIKAGKAYGDDDFVASATDVASGAVIADHGYRGGPWVIDAADAVDALPIVEAWQQDNPDVAVHEASEGFTTDVAQTLVIAPTIAMMADGNQKIARKYMMAAGIPDSVGDYGWPDASPDMLDPEELSGPTEDNMRDGALFDAEGDPVYCQFMSMHWGVNDAKANPQVVAEMREFLTHPTHLFAECQAVNAFENLAAHGHFLTPNGFLIGDQPDMYDYHQTDTPFGQLDGPFQSVGGSEPAYSLPEGDSYKGSDIVMITEAGTPIGVNDVWMTGFVDGICPGLHVGPGLSAACLTAGKVSYLGGHEYDVDLPISENPTTQGTRLFLNSLFEAPCATAEGLPQITVTKAAPATTDVPEVTFDITYVNMGVMPALDAVLTDTLPAGVTFVSATDDGSHVDGVVTWNLGNLGEGEGKTVSVTVELGAPGVYENSARVQFRAGVNALVADSNATMTAYGVDPTTDGGTSGETTTSGTGDSASESGAVTTTAVPTTGGGLTGAPTSTGAGGSEGGDTAGETGGETGGEGCGCRNDMSGGAGPLALLGLAALARRRRRVA